MVYLTPPTLTTSFFWFNLIAPVPYRTFKFSNGFSSIITKSASFPISTDPIMFWAPKASAPFKVAALITSKGWKPASLKSSNSLI